MIEQAVEHGGQVFRRVLETLSEPLIVLGSRRAVHFANAAADAVLKADEGLALRGTTLVAESRDVQARLAAAILAVASAPKASCPVLLKQRGDGRCSVLHLSLLGGGNLERPADPQDVRILGTICLNSALPDIQTLRQAFGLSQSEAEIALLITAGYSPRRIASKRESSEETVRWHIKNIYSKTFTNRLVDLALQLAAARSPFFTLENAPVRRALRQFSVPPAIAMAGTESADAPGLPQDARKPAVRMPA